VSAGIGLLGHIVTRYLSTGPLQVPEAYMQPSATD
jgi:hypothetical protein